MGKSENSCLNPLRQPHMAYQSFKPLCAKKINNRKKKEKVLGSTCRLTIGQQMFGKKKPIILESKPHLFSDESISEQLNYRE